MSAKLRKKVPFLFNDMRPRLSDYLDEQLATIGFVRPPAIDFR